MAEESMIERVARAIAHEDGQNYSEDERRFCLLARAAIEAISKPTTEMIEAGDLPDCDAPHKPASGVWAAMIDKALAESKAS